jgi:5-formyltetrahydrofolate cyclo-ligase
MAGVPEDRDIESLRSRLRALLEGRQTAPYELASERICAALLSLEEIKRSTRIAAFWPIRGEADIRPALRALLERSVRIFLPRIDGSDLSFVETRDLDPAQMLHGNYGIPHPPGDASALESMDCVVVPGLGFDASCNRLGRGKGIYDRALSAQDSTLIRIGVGFSDQIVEEGLEAHAHDVSMHVVVTEQKIYRP